MLYQGCQRPLGRALASSAGSAAMRTSPTACRLPAATFSSVSYCVVPRDLARSAWVLEIDDVDGRNAGRKELQVIVFDRRRLGDELAPVQPLRAALQIASVSHGVEFASRLMTRSAVADHVDQDERPDVLERAGLPRRIDVVAAAVGVIGALPVDDRFLAVEEEQLDRAAGWRVTSARAPAR